MTKSEIYKELESLLEFSTKEKIIQYLCNWFSSNDLIEFIEFIKTEQI